MRTAVEIATDLLKRLREAGHQTYFAGGWVRDYLLGIASSDIDLSTAASPDEVIALFPKTIPVGKAFGVVIVVEEGHSFEVASFRKDGLYLDGRHPSTIERGTPEEDAERRDFTINGLFFDPEKEEVIDYVGGGEDLKKGVLRAIGDPKARFREDRLRMIRAARFASRFCLQIEPETEKAVQELAHTLFPAVAPERIWQEWLKMGESPLFGNALLLLERLNLLPHLLPELQGRALEPLGENFNLLPPYISLPIRWALVFQDRAFENRLLELRVPKAELKAFLFALEQIPLLKALAEGIEGDPVAWVEFFAHPHAEELFHGARLLYPSLGDSLAGKREVLHECIVRKKAKKSLLGADRLLKEGIPPGKRMGSLLEEGEKRAIVKGLKTEDEVLDFLKSLPLWSEG
jgi:poly(A) polymerase